MGSGKIEDMQTEEPAEFAKEGDRNGTKIYIKHSNQYTTDYYINNGVWCRRVGVSKWGDGCIYPGINASIYYGNGIDVSKSSGYTMNFSVKTENGASFKAYMGPRYVIKPDTGGMGMVLTCETNAISMVRSADDGFATVNLTDALDTGINNYSMTVDGCRQILWGVFKKVVIADNLATYVDPLWSNIGETLGSTLLLGIVLYYIQLYADFSGYTDMAIGMSKTLGLKISNNFKTPLFALNISDYWKCWHISLTSWLTDYIFIPLNVKYRDAGKWGVVLAIMVTFTVSGLWHGANWTYVLWGVYHGLLYIPLILLGAFYKKAKIKTNRLGLPVLKDVGRMFLTTTLVVIGLILFRAPDVHTAWSYMCGMCHRSLLSVPNLISYYFYIPMIIAISMMIIVEWCERKNEGYPTFSLFSSNRIMRWGFYILLLAIILVWGTFNNQQYIYFQF